MPTEYVSDFWRPWTCQNMDLCWFRDSGLSYITYVENEKHRGEFDHVFIVWEAIHDPEF